MTLYDDVEPPSFRFTRRKFLIGGSVAGATAFLVEDAGSVTGYASLGQKTLTRHLRRRDDQLSLRFDFYNLVRDTRAGRPSQLIRKLSSRPAFVAVTFPPQAVAEATVPELAVNAVGPVGSVASGPTRLVFVVPDRIAAVPFSAPGLLSWLGWTQNVAPYAADAEPAASGDRGPHAPTPAETAIELPWRLALSPMAPISATDRDPTWVHATGPVTRGGRTELWHTRLGAAIRVGDGGAAPIGSTELVRGPLRAIWAFPGTEPFGGAGALSANDRADIVANQVLAPIDVEQLMLTPLGGYLRGGAAWPTAPTTVGNNLVEWRHRTTLGRDHYVLTVRKGHLYPFGHPAMWTQISERKFTVLNGRKTAFLRKRQFLTLRRQTLGYPLDVPDEDKRQFPFRSVTVGVRTTPLLSGDPTTTVNVDLDALAGGGRYLFPCTAVDQDGRTVTFESEMVWVPEPTSTQPGAVSVADAKLPASTRAVEIALRGQRVSMVPSTPGTRPDGQDGRDVSLVSELIAVRGVEAGSATGSDLPAFAPVMVRLSARVPAVEATTGSSTAVDVYYAPVYLANGLPAAGAARANAVGLPPPANVGEVFASLKPPIPAPGYPTLPTPPKLPVQLPPRLAGGVAAPSFVTEGLSRAQGAVADLANTAKREFDPEKYFGDVEGALAGETAKLLGTIPLKDILDVVKDVQAEVDKLPNLHTTLIFPNGDKTKLPTGSITVLGLAPKPKADPLKIFEPNGETTIALHVQIRTDFEDPEKSTYDISGVITNFQLTLIGTVVQAIEVPVRRLSFRAVTGSKTDLTLDIGDVRFTGVLAFVNDLAKYLKFGKKSGPYVDVTPTAIEAGVRLALPSISAGIFQISNVAFAMSIRVPFAARMRLDIAFSSRKEPFLVTVFAIGGGGWVTIGLGLDGFEAFDIGLEFGASVALDLGVASGEVHIFIGIYFSMQPKEIDVGGGKTKTVTETKLEAYLRFGGSLEVLGIVTLSVELYIGFTYVFPNKTPAGNKLIGRATLVMEVSVLGFSETVSVEVKREIDGPASADSLRSGRAAASLVSGDRSFGQQISASDWSTYCNAFASGA